MNKIKDNICKSISYLLPNRLVLWTIVRAYSYTTIHSYKNIHPDEIGYSKLWKSWNFKTKYRVNDRGLIRQ